MYIVQDSSVFCLTLENKNYILLWIVLWWSESKNLSSCIHRQEEV